MIREGREDVLENRVGQNHGHNPVLVQGSELHGASNGEPLQVF